MIYVFDIDGTLSFDGKSIEEDIVLALEKLLEAGNEVIFASARPIRDMVNIIPERFKDLTWIGGNGAFIKKDNIIESVSFDEYTKNKIMNLLADESIEYMLDSDWDFSYKGSTNNFLYNNINKDIANNINYRDHKTVSKLVIFDYSEYHIDYFNKLNVLITYHSNENLIDISPGKCDKYDALLRLGVKDYIAFGNDANDVPMFINSYKSYCVGESEYSKFSDYVIKSSDVAASIISLLKEI